MKSRQQKENELKKGRELLDKSRILIFVDLAKIPAENLKELRREVKNSGANLLVIKNRLLNLIFKSKGMNFDARRFKLPMGTIFSAWDLEKIGTPVFKFFSSLGTDSKSRKEAIQKILGGYDLGNNNFIESEKILFVGQLPSREILLAQLLRIMSAPISSLLYVLGEKAKKVVHTT